VRDAGAPHAALGTTLLVAGLGLLAHAALTVSGTLRVLTVLRETLAPPPRA
jgi:hypothetical protein